MLQAFGEAQNSHRLEVDGLQSTIDELKNELSVSKSASIIIPAYNISVAFFSISAPCSTLFSLLHF